MDRATISLIVLIWKLLVPSVANAQDEGNSDNKGVWVADLAALTNAVSPRMAKLEREFEPPTAGVGMASAQGFSRLIFSSNEDIKSIDLFGGEIPSPSGTSLDGGPSTEAASPSGLGTAGGPSGVGGGPGGPSDGDGGSRVGAPGTPSTPGPGIPGVPSIGELGPLRSTGGNPGGSTGGNAGGGTSSQFQGANIDVSYDRAPILYSILEKIVIDIWYGPFQWLATLLLMLIFLGPFVTLFLGFFVVTYSLFHSSRPKLGLDVSAIEQAAEKAKNETGEGSTFFGVERFEWLRTMEAQFDRLSKEVGGLLSNAKVTFGAAIVFIGLSLLWTFILVYRVFTAADFGLAQAFALVSPLVIFLGTASYLLRSSLRVRQEVAVARQEMNEVQLNISKAIASIDSKEDFSVFLQGLLKPSKKEHETMKNPETAGVADNPRILAAIISALSRGAS